MTLRHIKIFVTVCQTGSITAAGEKLFIAQPSISVAISELENYYGIKLFDRISKRLYITEPGKKLLQYANHIVKLFDEMETEVKNFDNHGVIRIGASITIGTYLLPKYVKSFKEIYPDIEVQAIVDNSDTIEQHILNNYIDIGLIEGNIHNSYIKSHHFKEDKLVLICGINHPLSNHDELDINDIKNENFLLREKGSAGRELCDNIFATAGIDLNIICESSSSQAIIKAVTLGLGLSILPYLLVKDSINRKEIKMLNIKNISLDRYFSVIYHKNKFLTNSAKAFIDICE